LSLFPSLVGGKWWIVPPRVVGGKTSLVFNPQQFLINFQI
jgi:hypothetical protein